MQKYTDVVQNRLGLAVEGAKALVTDTNGSVATIFSDNGTNQQPNPMTTDANGSFAFYAADGRYNLTITINNVQYGERRDILLNDPADPSPEKIDGGVIVNSQVNKSEVNDCTITGGTAKQATVTGSTISQSEVNDCTITGGTAKQVTITGSTISQSGLEDVTIDGLPPMTVGGLEHHDLVEDVQQLTAQSRETLRRTYADAGLNLVDGSFEEGGVLTTAKDVLLYKANNIAYSGATGVVNAGTIPTLVGSTYVPHNTDTLRVEVGMRRFTSAQAPSQSYYEGELVYITDVGYVFRFKSSRCLIAGQSASEITFNDNLHILVTAGGMLQFYEFDKLRSVQSTNTARFAAAIKDRTTPITVDCYGNSITFGQALADTAGATNKIGSATGFGDGSTHEHWQFNNNYPQWVASYLDDNFPQSGSVNNYGYSGDRVISGYLRHRVVSGSLAATIMYGINDCLFATSSGVNPEHLTTDPLYSVVHYQEALRLFAAKQILQGKCVTILSTTQYGAIAGFDGTQLAAMKLNRAYNAAAKQVAAEFGCRYVDMTQDVFNQYGIMEITQEATHLGPDGLKIAGERIASALVLVETENRVCHGSVLIANPGINAMLSKDAVNVVGNSTSSTPPGDLSSNPSCVNVSAEWLSIPFYAETDGLVAFVNGVASGTPPIGAEIKLDFGAVQSNYHYQHSYLSGKPVAEKSLSLLPKPFKRDNQNISDTGAALLVVANRGWHTISIRKTSGSMVLDSISFEALESVLASDVYGVTASCSVSAGVLDSGARNIASVLQDYPGEFSILFTNPMANNKYTIAIDVNETSADPVTVHSRYKGVNSFSLAFNKWNGTAWVKFVPIMFTVKVIGGR